MDRREFVAALAAGLASAPAWASAADGELRSDARDAWLYVIPLIEVAAARARAVVPTTEGGGAANVLRHARKLAGPADRGVTTPNNDTLYSTAFLDLTQGPVTLQVPDTGTRYLSVAIMDMYSNNNVILGKRTPGGAAGTWSIIGPGDAPGGARDLSIATPHAWLLVRTLVLGQADLPAAHAVQDRIRLSGPATPPPLVYAGRKAPWSDYFRSADALLKSDPPPSKAGLEAFERVKSAGRRGNFDPSGYAPADAAAIAAGVTDAQAFCASARRSMTFQQGWNYPKPNLGDFRDDFVFRALVAIGGLAALKPQEAMYMRPEGDNGQGMFTGDGPYRFSLPGPLPLDGFWSLTMYEAMPDGQFFLTENPIHRYAIGDRTPGLRTSFGGAIDIWVARNDPGGERSANWLPAPRSGPFTVTLRTYLPSEALLSGAYRLPPMTRA